MSHLQSPELPTMSMAEYVTCSVGSFVIRAKRSGYGFVPALLMELAPPKLLIKQS